MPAQLSNFFLGRQTTAATLSALDISSTGSLTIDGTFNGGVAYSFLAVFKSIKRTYKNTMEDVSSTSQRGENEMIVSSGTVYEVEGLILGNDAAGISNIVSEMVGSGQFDYTEIVVTRAGRTTTFYGVVRQYEEGIVGKGSVSFTFELGPVNIATANPVFS
jgi:hypothetical protein